ncbi:M10 family metallopeptidase C-terminal domain-containing protein [Bradyrhizobium jicamae]|uniref:FG-GAP-like repeat-containing protein n=1 Tax=Bradyrhizobium jicamae TaxID=280332 RepID=UPI001BA4E9EE|nr:FG-GAP-like repeat-containing protein [Bradyrhizobium jicamae]MBR0756673.1 M10 family metallopeptidase C-terminal domain-containing protein [Bradyrhizobium jicamae]
MRKSNFPSDDFASLSAADNWSDATLRTMSAGGAVKIISDDGDAFPLAGSTSASSSAATSASSAKPVGTIPQLADYLVNGFWAYNNTSAHHWGSNTITFNINGLNAAEQALALSALQAWHEVANVTFVQTSGSANITFIDTGTMTAVTNANWTYGGIMTSATVDISSDWITNDGGAYDGKTGIDSYGYQTYIHEIGHALGLGHQGPYNGSATYSSNAIYADDTWQYSIMSYFAQDNYSGSSYRYVVTPQMADIYAVGLIYGASTTTRTGNTVYGFNSNAGAVFNFGNYTKAPALTIYDSGGTDTLDCSGYSAAQTIDLHAGAFSSVGGLVHNIGIALNTTIENAIGGSGNDTLIANDSGCTLSGGAGNDTLTGGAGADRLIGGTGVDTMTGGGGADTFVFATGNSSAVSGQHDKITDFTSGVDKIDLSAFDAISSTAAIDSFKFIGAAGFDGTAGELDYGYNSSTGITMLQGDVNGDKVADFIIDLTGNIVVSASDLVGIASQASLVNDSIVTHAPDFNGDGDTDLLFVNSTTNGVAEWQMNGAQVIFSDQVGTLASGFHFANTGDFNGDGKTDLLMLNDTTHDVAVWQMNGGQVTSNVTIGTINAAGGWHLEDTGDYNGDGKTDLLFLNDGTGGVAVWQMNGTQVVASPQVGTMASGFHYAASGDFNGDGKTDLLMINDTTHAVSIWQMNGTQSPSVSTVGTINASAGWQFEAVGDFNGDGDSDLLFLNSSTHGVAVWLMNGSQVTASPQVGTMNASGGWNFADVGDFNGDGKSDLLFLNSTTNGVAVWQMNGTQVVANPQVGIAAAGDGYMKLEDINGDHKSDILFENSTTHALTAWEMNGTQIALNQQIGTINAAGGWHLVS